MQEIFGDFDSNLRTITGRFNVKIYAKGLDVFIAGNGSDVTAAKRTLRKMLKSGGWNQDSHLGEVSKMSARRKGEFIAKLWNLPKERENRPEITPVDRDGDDE